jgi:hypothetical protein
MDQYVRVCTALNIIRNIERTRIINQDRAVVTISRSRICLSCIETILHGDLFQDSPLSLEFVFSIKTPAEMNQLIS